MAEPWEGRMLTFDLIILASAVGTFLIYLLVHTSIFRFIDTKGILPWLMRVFFIGGFLNVVVNIHLLLSRTEIMTETGILGVGFCLLLSLLIYGLMCFFYVLNIYGPYESSLSVRLIREIFPTLPGGITLKEILTRYNADVIPRTRLERLIGSGEIVMNGPIYKIGKYPYIFLTLNYLGRIFHRVTLKTRAQHIKNITNNISANPQD